MAIKKEYSEKEIKTLLGKIKPEANEGSELRLERLENDLRVAFLAVSQLKSELDKLKSSIGEDYPESRMEPEELKKVSKKKVAQMIKEYVSINRGCKTSDIIFSLKLHPDIVMPILRRMQKNGKVRSEKIEQEK